MLNRVPSPTRSTDAQMLAAADRLFAEFDDLSVLTVVRSINAARSRLRELGGLPTPAAIEALAALHLREISDAAEQARVDAHGAVAATPRR